MWYHVAWGPCPIWKWYTSCTHKQHIMLHPDKVMGLYKFFGVNIDVTACSTFRCAAHAIHPKMPCLFSQRLVFGQVIFSTLSPLSISSISVVPTVTNIQTIKYFSPASSAKFRLLVRQSSASTDQAHEGLVGFQHVTESSQN